MDVFDLVAKIRLDSSEYEKGVGDAKGKFSTLATGVKNGLTTVAKVGAAAVSAGVAGVAALTKMGVEGYAQYEQLAGGVQTLFGAGGKSVEEYAASVGKTVAEVQGEYDSLIRAQNDVMQKASTAYINAGMSANQYMETVTSFSASLIQSLGGDTEKAAVYADRAIVDMSDNANKMGTSMEMIQNAYNGFAKSNYTMLDNLKLGYGGTQEEMKRLIKDAAAMTDVQEKLGITVDASSMSFDNVVNAISVMQDSLGIAGATANEAATTIEGSLNMMKGAWQNLVVGMADSEADMELLINNFVESTATAAKNLLPRIEQTLKGIGQLIEKLAPVIAQALPVLIESVLPSLVTAGVSLITAIVKGCVTALPALYAALLEGVQVILVQVFGVSEQKAGEFADGLNSFFVKIKDGFLWMVEAIQTDGTVLNDIWTRLKQAFELVKAGLEIAFEYVSTAFHWCVEQFKTDGTWLNETWDGIVETVRNAQEFLSAAFDVIAAVFRWCVEQFKTEGTALNTAFKNIAAIATGVFESIKTEITGTLTNLKNAIKLFTSVLRGDWSGAFDALKNISKNSLDTVSRVFETAKNTVKKIIDNIKGFFNFEFKWPKLKMPRFGVSPKGWQIGDLLKGSIPKLSIEWYRKAYDRAMVLSSPTIFGYSNGSFLGGGDGNGNEIVAGESHLMGLMGKVVDSRLAAHNAQIIALLAALLDEVSGGNSEIVRAIREDKTFAVGEREFARLVKTYA